MTLGPNKGTYRPGPGLRWLKVRRPPLDARAPVCRLHGLRMLDPAVFTRLPFSSADSTTIGRNVGIDSRWTGAYTPPSKPARAALLRARIEAHNAPPLIPEYAPEQSGLFA